jgi:hypothetical protein
MAYFQIFEDEDSKEFNDENKCIYISNKDVSYVTHVNKYDKGYYTNKYTYINYLLYNIDEDNKYTCIEHFNEVYNIKFNELLNNILKNIHINKKHNINYILNSNNDPFNSKKIMLDYGTYNYYIKHNTETINKNIKQSINKNHSNNNDNDNNDRKPVLLQDDTYILPNANILDTSILLAGIQFFKYDITYYESLGYLYEIRYDYLYNGENDELILILLTKYNKVFKPVRHIIHNTISLNDIMKYKNDRKYKLFLDLYENTLLDTYTNNNSNNNNNFKRFRETIETLEDRRSINIHNSLNSYIDEIIKIIKLLLNINKYNIKKELNNGHIKLFKLMESIINIFKNVYTTYKKSNKKTEIINDYTNLLKHINKLCKYYMLLIKTLEYIMMYHSLEEELLQRTTIPYSVGNISFTNTKKPEFKNYIDIKKLNQYVTDDNYANTYHYLLSQYFNNYINNIKQIANIREDILNNKEELTKQISPNISVNKLYNNNNKIFLSNISEHIIKKDILDTNLINISRIKIMDIKNAINYKLHKDYYRKTISEKIDIISNIFNVLIYKLSEKLISTIKTLINNSISCNIYFVNLLCIYEINNFIIKLKKLGKDMNIETLIKIIINNYIKSIIKLFIIYYHKGIKYHYRIDKKYRIFNNKSIKTDDLINHNKINNRSNNITKKINLTKKNKSYHLKNI